MSEDALHCFALHFISFELLMSYSEVGGWDFSRESSCMFSCQTRAVWFSASFVLLFVCFLCVLGFALYLLIAWTVDWDCRKNR